MPADFESWRNAGTGSPLRAQPERQGRVVKYTDPPVVTVVRERSADALVNVWNGPLKGKQRYIPAEYLNAPKTPPKK